MEIREQKSKTISLSSFLFFLSYGLYLVVTLMNISFYAIYINQYLKSLMIISCLIIIFKELFCQKVTLKEVYYLFICICLSAIVLLRSNGVTIFPIFFLLYGARKVKFEKIAKFTIIESSVIFILIVLSAKLGIILNYSTISNNRVRSYLGFRYPLYPQMLLFNITALYLYVCNKVKKNSIIIYLFILILNYILFKYTDSRLSFYLAAIMIVIIYFLNNKPTLLEKRKIISLIMSFSFMISAALSLYMIFHYDSSKIWMRNLNDALGNRLEFGFQSTKKYSINLLGNDVNYIGNGLNIDGVKTIGVYNYVDCLYLNILEKYGIIFTIIFIGLLTYTTYSTYKNKDYIMLIILTFFALHGIVDDLEIYLYYNTFWFAISKYFIKKERN